MKTGILVALFMALLIITAAQPKQSVPVPRQVVHRVFNDASAADDYISACVKQGFVIKLVTASESNCKDCFKSEHYFVVAEKY